MPQPSSISQVEEDIEEMRAEERAQQAESSTTMFELICSPTLRTPLYIGVVLQLSQQLSGINAVRYWTSFPPQILHSHFPIPGILLLHQSL